jgi:hypothetical protein
VTGTVTVRSANAGRKKFSVTAPLTVLAPGRKGVASFSVPKKVRKAAARALHRKGRVKASLVLTVSDPVGNTRTLKVDTGLR